MFFNKSKLEGEIAFLRVRVDLLASACEQLETRIERLEAARWGLKVDGTPKAKPGRKVKDVRIS
jgi:hypothetical protein